MTMVLSLGGVGGVAAVGNAAVADASGSLSGIAACEGTSPGVFAFGEAAPPVLGWRENLVFDGRGLLWTSNVLANTVEAFDPTGVRVASVVISAPGGLTVGPDGRVYVVTGSLITAPDSRIWAINPDAPQASPELVAVLPAGKNGLASDRHGNFYTTGMLDHSVTKVRPDGSVDADWSRQAAVFGTNGIAIHGDTAFATVTLSTETVVHEFPLANPGAGRAVVVTRLPNLPRGLDDLAVTNDYLYLAAMTVGEIIRVDRTTGQACHLVGGIPGPTSVRVAEGFGAFGAGDLFVTSIDGSIRHLALG